MINVKGNKARYLFGLVFLSNITMNSAYAEFIQWHSSNIQLLRGWDYSVGEQKRSIITIEHANAWEYGDLFAFVDITWPDNQSGNEYYAEISPRFSLSKMLKRSYSTGLIKDVLIATTFEKGEGNIRAYLYGPGVDISLPGFTFFQANLYLRNDIKQSENTYQLTLAWNRPFRIGNIPCVFEGFADFAGNADPNYAQNKLIVPRILVDIGSYLGVQDKRLLTGAEWQYWHNKFGLEGVKESVLQLQVKWVF